jgi:hypothetical protein
MNMMKFIKIAGWAVNAMVFGLGLLAVASLIVSGKLVLAFFVGLLTIFGVLHCIGVFD